MNAVFQNQLEATAKNVTGWNPHSVGVLINDPILLKRAEDCYWLSIADSNIWFWAEAIAREQGQDVEVSEPDVSPLSVQGPKGENVVAFIFGDWIRDLKYFWFGETEINGIPVAIARSGWSKRVASKSI